MQRFEAYRDGSLIFFAGETQDGPPGFEHLIGALLFILKVQYRIKVKDVVFREDVALFGECCFDYLRRCRYGGTRV